MGIARKLLGHYWQRGEIERRARRRLGVERLAVSDASLERVEALIDDADPRNSVLLATSRPRQLAALGVLRRPQNSGDRVIGVQSLLRLLTRDGTNGVHTDAIRLLRHHTYGATILMPVERNGDLGIPRSISRHVLCILTGFNPSARGRDADADAGAGQVCGDPRQLETSGTTSPPEHA